MRCKTCAILAGGAAKRFDGLTKSKLMIGGRPLMSRILDAVEGLFREILIVTNTPEEFSEYGIPIIHDIIIGSGPLGGIHAALKASTDEAVFVVAGDMPLLDKKIISMMLNRFEENSSPVLTPYSAGHVEPLHSIYFTSLAPEIEEFIKTSEKPAVYEFFNNITIDYFEHDNSEQFRDAFMNINLPEDIARTEEILNRSR